MLRPGLIRLPKNEAAEAERAAGFERKQKWKELPGNRSTAEELRKMSKSLGPICITGQEPQVMHLD